MYLLNSNISERFSSLDFLLAAILIVVLLVLCCILFKKLLVRLVSIVMSLLIIVSLLFELYIVSALLLAVLLSFISVVGFINAGAIRNYIANPSKTVKTIKWFGNNKIETDEITQESAINIVCEAVASLSKSKTGALITFERKDSLEDYIKTGTIINAPITKEIIETIFYPGTRLHDGAIVIKDGRIVSASVYYTPTTKPLAGKYGARHRAAMGISESTDAVTVVVSEETGRISIAANGELISVAIDSVSRMLEDFFDAKD